MPCVPAGLGWTAHEYAQSEHHQSVQVHVWHLSRSLPSESSTSLAPVYHAAFRLLLLPIAVMLREACNCNFLALAVASLHQSTLQLVKVLAVAGADESHVLGEHPLDVCGSVEGAANVCG